MRSLMSAAVVAAFWICIGRGAPAAAQVPSPAHQGFSFYGVKFGMTKAEIDQRWLPLSEGTYAVSSPAVRQVKPIFDHEGKMYEFSFAVELQFPNDPPGIVHKAFQEALDERWKKDPGLTVSLVVGRDANQVTIQHNRLREAYIRAVQGKITDFLKP